MISAQLLWGSWCLARRPWTFWNICFLYGCGTFKRDIYWSTLVQNYRTHSENFPSGYYITAETHNMYWRAILCYVEPMSYFHFLSTSSVNRIKHVFLVIFFMFSWSPEKTLPFNLTGTARMKQHKRLNWNEALTALAQRLWPWKCGEAASSFFRGVFVWELSSCTVWGDVWPLRLHGHEKRAVLALFTGLVALSSNVWEVSP